MSDLTADLMAIYAITIAETPDRCNHTKGYLQCLLRKSQPCAGKFSVRHGYPPPQAPASFRSEVENTRIRMSYDRITADNSAYFSLTTRPPSERSEDTNPS